MRADWEAVVISEKCFGNMHTARHRNIGVNGRIVIHKGRNGIFILYEVHYNDTCKGNRPVCGMEAV